MGGGPIHRPLPQRHSQAAAGIESTDLLQVRSCINSLEHGRYICLTGLVYGLFLKRFLDGTLVRHVTCITALETKWGAGVSLWSSQEAWGRDGDGGGRDSSPPLPPSGPLLGPGPQGIIYV